MKVVKKLIKEFFDRKMPKEAKALLMQCVADMKSEPNEYQKGVFSGVTCTLYTLGYISMSDALDFVAIVCDAVEEGDI